MLSAISARHALTARGASTEPPSFVRCSPPAIAPSVLGTYSIDRDGDTSLRSFGAYGVSGGRLQFLRAIDT